AERFACGLLIDAGDLVHDATRLDVRRPFFDAAFASTHSNFEGLRRNGAVREDADPELTDALHVARDRHTAGFDLTRGQTARLDGLHGKVAEGNIGTAACDAFVVALLHLAELG